jgi:phosphatidate cytidylyltransferase
MLLHRFLSALVLIPSVLYIVWLGNLPLFLLVALLIIIGCKELANILNKQDLQPSLALGVTTSLLALTTAYYNDSFNAGLIFVIIVISNLVLMVFRFPEFNLRNTAGTIFMAVYIGWLFTHLFLLRGLENGWHYIVLMFITTWATDTFAYFTGRNLGRNKLAPQVSPNKTIEGALGGIIGSIVGALFVYLLGESQVAFYHYVSIGILVGIFGQVGDLAESALKRLAGVKDSGHIIPGHGGVLDRLDSTLFTAPLIYYYLKLIVL